MTRFSRTSAIVVLASLCLVVPSVIAVSSDLSAADAASIKPFLGRWDLTVKAPDREYPGWIEITLKDGQLHGLMVGRWNHAEPVLEISVSGGTLSFVSPQDEWDRKDNMPFEGKITGGHLKDQRILFLGAGSAAIGLANLIVSAMGQQGVAPDLARQQIRLFDTQGLVVAGRPGLAAHKLPYAHKLPPSKAFDHLDPASECPQLLAAI